LAGVATTEAARDQLVRALTGGAALRKFAEMVRAQGGEASVVDDPSVLPAAPAVHPVPAPAGGYVVAIDAEALGLVAMRMGAGREAKEDTIDPAVGLMLMKKVGDLLEREEPLAELHLRTASQAADAASRVAAAYVIGAQPPPLPVLVHEVVA
jgi:thymidine phosphorylase